MDIFKEVLKNEELIESFDILNYKKEHKYAIYGALSALEITNEVQKSFYKENKNLDLMSLYGLLQSLFVSIDALYELSYNITNSKKFININNDPNLRQLKHIRNDVVGHPANRNTRFTYNAYCVLDKNSLTSSSFKYSIYSESEVKDVLVNLDLIAKAYYEQTNSILELLLKKVDSTNIELNIIAKDMLLYFDKGLYLEKLELLYDKYLIKYPDACKKQHRFIWRYDLVKQIINYDVSDNIYLKELKEDVIYLELLKIYQLITDSNDLYEFNRKNGILYKSINRFFHKHKEFNHYKKYLLDFSSPYFMDLFRSIKKKVYKSDHLYIYITFLEKLIKEENSDLIYAYMLPIK